MIPRYHGTDPNPSMGTTVSSDSQHFSPRRAARHRGKRHTWRNAFLLVGGLLAVLIICVLVYVGFIGAAFNDRRQTVDAGITAGDDGVLVGTCRATEVLSVIEARDRPRDPALDGG